MIKTEFDLENKEDREFIIQRFIDARGYRPMLPELKLFARSEGYIK